MKTSFSPYKIMDYAQTLSGVGMGIWFAGLPIWVFLTKSPKPASKLILTLVIGAGLLILIYMLRRHVKKIRHVNILDDDTLQIQTLRTKETIIPTQISKIDLTTVGNFYAEIEVIFINKTWRWYSSKSEAERFARTMTTIIPHIQIERKSRSSGF